MANRRTNRLSSSDVPDRSASRRGGVPEWAAAVALVAGGALALAWFDGGEEPLRPIAADVSLPEQGQ